MKKYLIILLLALSCSHAQQTVNQHAFIDDSDTSQQWRVRGIPVIISINNQ